jgi:hypothetical protein
MRFEIDTDNQTVRFNETKATFKQIVAIIDEYKLHDFTIIFAEELTKTDEDGILYPTAPYIPQDYPMYPWSPMYGQPHTGSPVHHTPTITYSVK